MSILILASSSPRRLALLQSIGIFPTQVIVPNINEQPLHKEKPQKMVQRLSEAKAIAVASNCTDDAFILSADTIIGTKSKIFDKAETHDDVAKCLQFFSGRRIDVQTSVSVISVKNNKISKIATKLVVSKIKFKNFSHEEMQHYITSGNGIGAAGGFAIQGVGETLVQWISGSYSGIVGLPLTETVNLLKGLGYDYFKSSS